VLDSSNYEAIGRVLESMPLKDTIINSVTLQKKRFEGFLPLITKYNTGVVALPIDDNGVPSDAVKRAENAQRLIKALKDAGVPPEKVYLDILVETAATGNGPKAALDAIRRIREENPDVHIICGLSNVSFGLPGRESLNIAFLSAAIISGLDAAIMDITSPAMQQALLAAEVIAGKDEYCLKYIEYFKKRD
jgi:5-methyltetrahydrofolate--homocysteine methyltransferase